MATELEQYLKIGADQLGIGIKEEEIKDFLNYYRLLVEENKKYNLTSIVDQKEVAIKHFVDSLACIKAFEFKAKKVADIGTGAGFPGIPLKIIYKDMNLLLTDSVNKKVGFVQKIIDRLSLEGASVIQARAEEMGRQKAYRESFDVVVSRAVASMNILLEYCLPLVRVGGIFLSMKGPGADAEIVNAANALEKLGGEIIENKRIVLPVLGDERYLVLVKKIAPTPAAYPRRPGMPAKKPL